MTRRTIFDEVGCFLILWPTSTRCRQHEVETNHFDSDLPTQIAATRWVRAIQASAVILELGRLGLVCHTRVAEAKDLLTMISFESVPQLPSNLHGLARDKAVLARDRFRAAGRLAAALMAEHESHQS